MKLLFIMLICTFIFSSCSTSTVPNEEKMDAPLKLKLAEMKRNSPEEKIRILGKCSSDISAELKEQLTGTGAEIESAVNSIFTSTASAEEIAKLSNLEFVTYIELSQKNESKL